MKKILTFIICVLLCSSSLIVYAENPGDGNIDGGGGGMGNGTASNKWSPGNDGVRVTIVDATTGKALTISVDFSNRSQPSTIIYFGKTSKIQYRDGISLSPSTLPYQCLKPEKNIPRIISSGSGSSSIEAIKKYFCSEYACKMIAKATGFEYDRLISGDYKLLIEPIAYFTYNGLNYCMTATEAALYDQLANGNLRSKMVSLTHQNLPLAMFLEFSDLGFSAWNGSKSSKQSNADIINYLGIGIVRFKEFEEPEKEINGSIEVPDVEYRIDTDVITSIALHTNSNLTPDNPASVTFTIEGKKYTVNNIVIPAGNSQVVWVKWHTPTTPQSLNIKVSVRGAYTAQDTFTAKIVDLAENIPPDPVATDKNKGYTVPSLPSHYQKLTANWGVWRCYWVPVWVWHSTGDGESGYWCDHGYWEYQLDTYSAKLSGSAMLLPDDIVPTAKGKSMKSGYGVKIGISTILSTSAPSGSYTYTQTAFSTFPEFQYQTYMRILKRTSGGMNTKFEFKENEFSTYKRSVHFTPIWLPNGMRYTIYTQVWDTWTPDGMLTINLNDYTNIEGSLYDDWYTNRE